MKRAILALVMLLCIVAVAYAIETSPNPGSAGTTTAVTGSSPITSTGGTTPVIACPTCVASGATNDLAQWNVNGENNPASPRYVANPRTATVTSTNMTVVTPGTGPFTITAANGFVNGEGVAVYQGGPNCNINSTDCGSITMGQATVAQTGYVGANGGTTVTYQYQCTATDAAYGAPAAGAASVSVNGPAVLSHPNTANGTGVQDTGGNYNTVTCPAQTGATHYVFWRNTAGVGNRLWALTDTNVLKDWINTQSFGTNGPFSNTPPASAQADVLATSIASGGGTTSLTFNDAVTQGPATLVIWPDATAAIQAAAAANSSTGGKVPLPPGFYKVRTLTPVTRTILYGAGSSIGAAKPSVLQGTPGYDVLAMPVPISDIQFRDFAINGGRNGFALVGAAGAITNVAIDGIVITGIDHADFYCNKCAMEEVWVRNAYFASGWYGYNLEGDGTGSNYINKCHFDNIQFAGQLVNSIRIYKNALVNGAVTFTRMVVTGAHQDAIYNDGPLSNSGLVIDGYSDEGVGSDFSRNQTTATCISGQNTPIVTSATGLAIGQNYTILGCGTSGDAYEGTICGIAGTTLTIQDPTCTTNTNAGTTQATAQFSTNAIFDNVYGTTNAGSFAQFRINNANLSSSGGCCGGTNTRFQVFAKSPMILDNVFASLVEDSQGATNIVDANGSIGLSRPTAAGTLFTAGQQAFPNKFNPTSPTTVTSSPGNEFNIGMVDSNLVGTGTYGKFSIWNNRAAARVRNFTLDPTNNGTFTVSTNVNTTTPTVEPGTSGMALTATTAGVQSYLATEFNISAGTNTFGLSTSYPTGTVIAYAVASRAGHFTNLMCQLSLFGTCTTAPIINVFDGTSNTGTQLQCANNATQTKGAGTAATAQTQTFAAGDQIGIYVVTQGATCLADEFSISAEATTP